MFEYRNSLAILCLTAVPALADLITPATYSANIGVGSAASLTKTVTVTQQLTNPVDIFFLADTTGSMGDAIANVRANVAAIIAATAALSPNTYYAIGEYKDVGDSFVYRLNQSMTNVVADVQAGVNQWGAAGGGDLPEAGLYALQRAAADSATGWRTGSAKLLFYFGDAISHDPVSGSTEASAIAALNARGVKATGVDVGIMNSTGQVTRVAAATGGQALSGSISQISSIIQAAINSSLSSYSNVSLETLGLLPGLTVVFTPANYSGLYDRGSARDFTFNVTFTGVAPGTYDFSINAKVDGVTVATETDHIVVASSSTGGGGGVSAVPEPSALLLAGLGLLAFAVVKRR